MYIYEKKSLKKSGLYIVFNAGSCYEADGQHGCHHLMEHLICQTFKDQYDILKKYNISWNAYTSEELVVVHFTGLSKYFTSELKILLVDRITNGFSKYVTEESFKNEQQTVYQEYLDVFNDSEGGHYTNIMREHFGNYSVIGNAMDILNFTLKDAQKLFKNVFKPTRIIEIGPTSTQFNVKYDESPVKNVDKFKWKKNYKLELQPVAESKKQTVYAICKKAIKKVDIPLISVAISMLNGGLNSPMYQEIREKRGLAYYSGADLETFINQGILFFYATTSPERVDELKDVYTRIFSNVKKYMTKQAYKNTMECLAVSREERKILRYENCDDLIRKGLPMLPKNLKHVTYEKVYAAMEKYCEYFELLTRP